MRRKLDFVIAMALVLGVAYVAANKDTRESWLSATFKHAPKVATTWMDINTPDLAEVIAYDSVPRIEHREMVRRAHLPGSELFKEEIANKIAVKTATVTKEAGRMGLGIVRVRTSDGEEMRVRSAPGDQIREGDTVQIYTPTSKHAETLGKLTGAKFLAVKPARETMTVALN